MSFLVEPRAWYRRRGRRSGTGARASGPWVVSVVIASGIAVAGLIAPNETSDDGVGDRGRRAGMMRVPGGAFVMGSERVDLADDAPAHRVRVSPFWMDRTEVTNREFRAFVEAKAYLTLAERALRATRWSAPHGSGSAIDDRLDHPVVQVTWEDAAAFCSWAGKRLPTEAEWELAARGGLHDRERMWGETGDRPYAAVRTAWRPDPRASGVPPAGALTTRPVASADANAYGLYDLAGSVREWVADWYDYDYYRRLAAEPGAALDPRGPPTSVDPDEPEVRKRSVRGGSWRCADEPCGWPGPAGRDKEPPHAAADDVGFRCAM